MRHDAGHARRIPVRRLLLACVALPSVAARRVFVEELTCAGGFRDDEIGAHAGLADTSRALATDASTVRPERLSATPSAAQDRIHGPRKGKGSVSVIDFATRKIEATWTIPGGGSPDMGNVSADGSQLWLSGRYDDAVCVFDTTSGAVKTIKVGAEPHGLTVWPQPGRYSLGHTGTCAEADRRA